MPLVSWASSPSTPMMLPCPRICECPSFAILLALLASIIATACSAQTTHLHVDPAHLSLGTTMSDMAIH